MSHHFRFVRTLFIEVSSGYVYIWDLYWLMVHCVKIIKILVQCCGLAVVVLFYYNNDYTIYMDFNAQNM